MAELKEFTLEEVAAHDTADDLWMIIHDLVYDVTDFADEHPGGGDLLVEEAGCDATEVFEDIGHSSDAEAMLKDYLIGKLKVLLMAAARERRESSYPMIPVETALQLVLSEASSIHLGSEMIPIGSGCLGRVVSSPIFAPVDLPSFPASMKDGYCFCFHEFEEGKEFNVKSTILAGMDTSGMTEKLKENEIYKIMTGASIPASCDTVIMIENTTLVELDENKSEKRITIDKNNEKGRDVRPVGSDISKGDLVIDKGESIGPAELGLLASCRIQEIEVNVAARVGILSTGNEIKDISSTSPLQPGQIYDANRPILHGLMAEFDGSIFIKDLGIVPDDESALFSSLHEALDKVDILISSGGVSMGEADLVKKWMETHGTIHFGRVLMKPGKPLTFATFERNGRKKLMFATPGNPVSSLVTSILFILPCIRVLKGVGEVGHPRIQVSLEHNFRLDPHRAEYHRVIVWWDCKTNHFRAQSTGSQASSRLLSMRSANGLLELPQANKTLHKGDLVSCLLTGPLPGFGFIPPSPPKVCHHHVC